MLIGYWKYVHTAVQVQVQSSTGLVLQDRCAGNPQRQYRMLSTISECGPLIALFLLLSLGAECMLIVRLLYAASNLAIYAVRLQRSFIEMQLYQMLLLTNVINGKALLHTCSSKEYLTIQLMQLVSMASKNTI